MTIAAAIVLVRFLYGLRTAGAVVLGTTEIHVAKYAAINVLGATAWATLLAGGGYSFASVIERVLASLQQLEGVVVMTLALLATWYWLRRLVRTRSARDRTATVARCSP